MLSAISAGWTLRAVAGPVDPAVGLDRPVPATVPGSVHTDLLAAGLVPDPYLDDNERRLAWIGLCDWAYETTFEVGPAPYGQPRTDLVLHGLDTVATVSVNGVEVLRSANMHRTFRLDVSAVLVEGPNTLRVEFASAVRYADRQSVRLGARPHVNDHPYNAIRKMACSFGWDWGPDLATAGLWKPVQLHRWGTARLAQVRPVVGVRGTSGTVRVHVDIERRRGDLESQPPLTVAATVAGVASSAEVDADGRAVVELEVQDAELWWPTGHGRPALHDLEVSLTGPDGGLDRWSRRIGFRDVEWRTEADDDGTSFELHVNGRPVFVKGANWIPDDAFPHRVDRARYAARLDQAEQAGLNLLRVWGGGVFESDDFYDECDERGLLTWQDFLFACAAYSEEEPLRSEVEAEVRDNVPRLMTHPSLVLWNGCNENLWGYVDWDWEVRVDGRTWGAGYYHDLLPRLVAELDPGRHYTPGSPFSPAGPASLPPRHPNDPDHGSMHLWDVWNDVDYGVYRDHSPRFAAEFGWQAPPTWSTLVGAISDDPLTPESPGMLVHQKAMEGQRKLDRGLVPHFVAPDDVDTWHWATSLNQARALRTGIEHFRASSPRCAGSVMWQLNDCWPVTSWAAVDGGGRAKPLLHALRHAHADRLVTVQPDGEALVAVLVNDTGDAWAGDVVLERLTFAGELVATATVPVSVAARGTSRVVVDVPLATPADASAELLVARLGSVRGLWFFLPDRRSGLQEAVLETDVRTDDGVHEVTVTARGAVVRDLTLLVDKVDPAAVVDEALVTLLPGESVTFRVTGAPAVDPSAFLAPTVLRTANELVVRGSAGRPGGPEQPALDERAH